MGAHYLVHNLDLGPLNDMTLAHMQAYGRLSSKFDKHISNNDIHVTEEDKERWDNKVDQSKLDEINDALKALSDKEDSSEDSEDITNPVITALGLDQWYRENIQGVFIEWNQLASNFIEPALVPYAKSEDVTRQINTALSPYAKRIEIPNYTVNSLTTEGTAIKLTLNTGNEKSVNLNNLISTYINNNKDEIVNTLELNILRIIPEVDFNANINVAQLLTSGVPIAEITVGSKVTTLYAPKTSSDGSSEGSTNPDDLVDITRRIDALDTLIDEAGENIDAIERAIEDGSIIEGSGIVNKLRQRISGLILENTSSESLSLLFSKYDTTSENFAAVLTKSTGTADVASAMSKFGNMKSGFITEASLEEATASMISKNDDYAAAVVTAVNNSGSNITLSADKVLFRHPATQKKMISFEMYNNLPSIVFYDLEEKISFVWNYQGYKEIVDSHVTHVEEKWYLLEDAYKINNNAIYIPELFTREISKNTISPATVYLYESGYSVSDANGRLYDNEYSNMYFTSNTTPPIIENFVEPNLSSGAWYIFDTHYSAVDDEKLYNLLFIKQGALYENMQHVLNIKKNGSAYIVLLDGKSVELTNNTLTLPDV